MRPAEAQHEVAVILPCRGRHDQTLAYAARMRAAAGDVAAARVNGVDWIAVGGQADRATVDALGAAGWRPVLGDAPTLTYWQALAAGTARSDAVFFAAVANDLWAHDRWLELGLRSYRARWPEEQAALLGFAGDGHPVAHSCHILIHRSLLAQLGGWPVWYRHNFGDAELCARTQALGCYAKARHAVLEHRHPIRHTAPDDAVYQAGQASWAQDQALFAARKAQGWPDAH